MIFEIDADGRVHVVEDHPHHPRHDPEDDQQIDDIPAERKDRDTDRIVDEPLIDRIHDILP